jgi:transcriptional regulator with XRE-family HTH domain
MKRQTSSASRLKQQLISAGAELRALRERRNMTMRQVHVLSRRISDRFGNKLLEIFPSRLHLIERGRHMPCLYRVQSMALIYGVSFDQILRWYGLPFANSRSRRQAVRPPAAGAV